MQQIEDILIRGVDEVIDREDLEQRLRKGERLRVKFGTDPTSPNIHLGRAVPLMKLRDLQRLGHQIVLIIGDFTGEVGDTSDKESGRPMLTTAEVRRNMQTYAEQCGKILDLSQTEVHYNSQWLSTLSFGEVCRLTDLFSIAEFTARSIIKDRLDNGKRVSARELLYPIMQGYDSVMVRADLELGGNDQRFNLLAGRTIQKHLGQRPQNVLMTNLINGLDGRKMSSSWGNTINLHDTPENMFGKLMSMVDSQIVETFIHCTRVPLSEVSAFEQGIADGTVNPRDAKLALAYEITRDLHGEEAADKARKHFRQVVQEHSMPEQVPEIHVSSRNIIDVLVAAGLAGSKGAARRLIQERGVRVDGTTVESTETIVQSGTVVNKGKRGYVKVM